MEIIDRESCVCGDKEILHNKLLHTDIMKMMLRMRHFEEKVHELVAEGAVYGTAHLSIGEEAACTGSTAALMPDDYIFATHRGHGQSIGKGCDINALMAELLGKETGLCRGRGGSMHIADYDKGILGTNGIVGANAPLACGAALACKKKGLNRVCAVFFGDGACNEGAVHEAMNLAAVWSLPVIFCLINNQYGMSMPLDKAMHETDLTKRAVAYGMKSVRCDGNDVLQVYETVKSAREYALVSGPVLVVEETYRTCGHSKSDLNLYRSEAEIEAWGVNNPIARFRRFLLEHSLFNGREIEEMESAVIEEVKEAVHFAMSSPAPRARDAANGVYA